jgi:putative membrane protein
MVERLPHLNVALNALAAAFLVAGWFAIRRGRQELHTRLMLTAVGVAALFLVSFLSHKALREEARELPEELAGYRLPYLLLFVTHFFLAATLVPMVVGTLWFAWRQRWERHRRLATLTFAAWLYVSLSGMVIYTVLYALY